MDYIRNPYMICLEISELKKLYKRDKENKIFQKIIQEKIDITNDETLKNFVDELVSSDLKHKEEIEIFFAIHFPVIFETKEAKICFAVKKNINLKRTSINSLQDLKDCLESDDLTDFALRTSDGLSAFQLKLYKDRLVTDDFFNFLVRMLNKYGNDIGDINLLIQLRGSRGIMSIDFEEISKKISSLNFSFSGHILVKYNEENKYHVLVQLYPDFGVIKEKIEPQYLVTEFSNS